MSLPRTIAALGALATISMLTLLGCAPDDKAPLPTPTESSPIDEIAPSPTEEVVNISGIVVDGDSVSVLITEGGVLIEIPFTTAPATAIEQLSEAIDLEPVTSEVATSACSGGTQTTWGAISFYYPYESAPPGVQFYAKVDKKQTNNGITVSMPSGQWPSYDGSDTIAANAAAPLIDYGPSLQVLAYDVKAGNPDSGPDDFWGASAIIRDDVLESFASPIHYYYDC